MICLGQREKEYIMRRTRPHEPRPVRPPSIHASMASVQLHNAEEDADAAGDASHGEEDAIMPARHGLAR